MTNSAVQCGYYFLNFLSFHIQKHLILHNQPISVNCDGLGNIKQIIYTLLTLIYMGYFDNLFYMGGQKSPPPPGLTLAFDFRWS